MFIEEGSQRAGAGTADMSTHDLVQVAFGADVEPLRLVHCPLELPAGELDRQIEERPSRGSDRNPAMKSALLGAQSQRAMDRDTGSAPSPRRLRNCHVDRVCAASPAQIPELTRGLMAEDGALAACKHRGQPVPLACEPSMTDGVDPTMKAVQPAGPGAVTDLVL